MEIITIEIKEASVIVHDGRLAGSRIYMEAANLRIYKIGVVTSSRKDDVFWHCQNQCIVRHIPLSQLRRVGCGCGQKQGKKALSDDFLRGLWDDMTGDEK